MLHGARGGLHVASCMRYAARRIYIHTVCAVPHFGLKPQQKAYDEAADHEDDAGPLVVNEVSRP